jgi:hypothetical protein
MLQADKRGVQRNIDKKLINGWIELSLIDELFSFLFIQTKANYDMDCVG